MLEVYDDRVEISNPGGLLIGVKKDFGNKSMTRNPLIFGLFTRMSLVEQVASGIPRMRKAMKDAGLPEPIFTTDGGFFTVEFKRPQKSDTVNGIVSSTDGTINGTINSINGTINRESPNEEIVLKVIADNEGLSAQIISKLIDKSLRTTMRYVDNLKKSNKIEFRGALKNGGYYVR